MKIIQDHFGLELKGVSNESITKPSSTSLSTTEKKIENRLNDWRNFFTDEELIRLQKVLDYFKIEIYGVESNVPLVTN